MRKKGFTLIELIIVMGMISIIAAIVLPRLDPFVPKRRLKSAGRRLSGTISLAYGEAISENKTYRLYLEPATDKYWITEVRKIEQKTGGARATGIKLGTHFELLQYTDGNRNVEQSLPTEPMFAPRELPDGIHFSSVEINRGLETITLDSQYIEFGPLGSGSPAVVNLVNEEGEMLVIRYDGVTGIPSLSPLKSES